MDHQNLVNAVEGNGELTCCQKSRNNSHVMCTASYGMRKGGRRKEGREMGRQGRRRGGREKREGREGDRREEEGRWDGGRRERRADLSYPRTRNVLGLTLPVDIPRCRGVLPFASFWLTDAPYDMRSFTGKTVNKLIGNWIGTYIALHTTHPCWHRHGKKQNGEQFFPYYRLEWHLLLFWPNLRLTHTEQEVKTNKRSELGHNN